MQCSFAGDSVFPRDRFVITPHFNATLPGTDEDQLCQDLATALLAWCTQPREVKVTSYDAQGTPPVFPNGQAIVSQGVTPNSAIPRELALCLSFYSQRNLPRQRGRLYLPAPLFGSAPAVRPSTTERNKVATLVPILTGLGGVDVDW